MLERFALARVIYGKPEMVKSESYGQWARYSDALELEAENAELKAKLATTEKALELACDEIEHIKCPAHPSTYESACNKQFFLNQAKAGEPHE